MPLDNAGRVPGTRPQTPPQLFRVKELPLLEVDAIRYVEARHEVAGAERCGTGQRFDTFRAQPTLQVIMLSCNGEIVLECRDVELQCALRMHSHEAPFDQQVVPILGTFEQGEFPT